MIPSVKEWVRKWGGWLVGGLLAVLAFVTLSNRKTKKQQDKRVKPVTDAINTFEENEALAKSRVIGEAADRIEAIKEAETVLEEYKNLKNGNVDDDWNKHI